MRCSYCHDGLPALWVCPRCRTVLHADCQQESHVCPSLGCEAEEAEFPPPRLRRSSVLNALLWLGALASLSLASAQLYEHVNPKPAVVALAPPPLVPELIQGDPGDPDAALKMQRFLRRLIEEARNHEECTGRRYCYGCGELRAAINMTANAWAVTDRTSEPLPRDLTRPRPSIESLGADADLALVSATRKPWDHPHATKPARAFFLRLAEEAEHLPAASGRACVGPQPPPTCWQCERLHKVVQAAHDAYGE